MLILKHNERLKWRLCTTICIIPFHRYVRAITAAARQTLWVLRKRTSNGETTLYKMLSNGSEMVRPPGALTYVRSTPSLATTF
jgi:hypothetical protein